jgi:hypothetical protein
MRILLDECVPRSLKNHFQGQDIHTVVEMGWAGKKNGELLTLMTSSGFEVFLTVDQNIKHQQNLAVAKIGVLVLVAATNRVADLMPLVPSAEKALALIKPGQVVEITS